MKSKIQPKFFLIQNIVIALTQKQILLFLLTLILFSSCETVTEIDFPEEKPQLVINAIFNADSLVKVDLTESQPVNNKSLNFKLVENASIEILKNTVSLGFLHYKGKGKYLSESKLPDEPNAVYSLKIKATGFETAEAAEPIPAKPMLNSMKVKADGQNNGAGYKSYKVDFNLNDSQEDNFYFLRVWLVNPTHKSPVYFRLYNDVGQFVPFGVAGSEMIVFDDQTFNGREVGFNLDLIQAYTLGGNGIRIQIELGSTNKSYYDYQFSLRKQIQGDPILNSSDYPVSSNIKNGLGIFAPYNAATFSFNVTR